MGHPIVSNVQPTDQGHFLEQRVNTPLIATSRPSPPNSESEWCFRVGDGKTRELAIALLPASVTNRALKYLFVSMGH